jgi:hypothetical protein
MFIFFNPISKGSPKRDIKLGRKYFTGDDRGRGEDPSDLISWEQS